MGLCHNEKTFQNSTIFSLFISNIWNSRHLFTVPWCEEVVFQTVTCLCLACDRLPGKLYTGCILLVGLISVDKHINMIQYTICSVSSLYLPVNCHCL